MANRPRALVSACLLGVRCRYDGGSQRCPGIDRLMEHMELIPVCPEQLGGLPTPRTPSERRDGRVFARDGRDVTDAFLRGAEETCRLAALYGARFAVLKQRSPSCGSSAVYDGSFTGRTVSGSGVTAQRLRQAGLEVFSEEQMDALIKQFECGRKDDAHG